VDVVEVLRALGGTARLRDARRHLTRRELEGAVKAGIIDRRGRTYHLRGSDIAIVEARELGGAASHRSAAAAYGMALPPGDDRPSVRIPPKARRSGARRLVRLRYGFLSRSELERGVTSPLRTVLDCLRDLSLREALSVGDSALRKQLVQFDELVAAAAAARGPGSAIVRRRVSMLDARAANAFESSCRAILLEAGVTTFRPQVTIRHNDQWIGRVDLADVAARVVIECDGWETHGTRGGWTKDARRHTLLVAAGWRPLRFTWEEVMFESEWVRDRVLETLDLAA
jgi:very-short-patch-repair endonuclease